MSRQFQKTTEDFKCAQCGYLVIGNGYTNHCPKCLYSRHVDVFPGDRGEACGGLMKPIAVTDEGGSRKLTHQCLECGFVRKNKVSDNDDFDQLVALSGGAPA